MIVGSRRLLYIKKGSSKNYICQRRRVKKEWNGKFGWNVPMNYSSFKLITLIPEEHFTSLA
jgi:hypothetical protein